VVWRGAFDLGSGSIKMKVAKVDACRGRVLEVLGARQVAVAHSDALTRDGQRLTAPVLARSVEAIRQLQRQSPVRPGSWAGGKLASLLTSHGSQSFKHLLLRLQGRDPATTESPNPISAALAARAAELVQQGVAAADPSVLARLREAAQKRVVGIGAVIARAVAPVAAHGAGSFTRAQLGAALSRRLGLTDVELVRAGSPPVFVDTAVSSLLLVHAYMSALGIDEVTVADVDLTVAVLLDPQLWPAIPEPASSSRPYDNQEGHRCGRASDRAAVPKAARRAVSHG
jgi:hypothetical protein